MAIVTVAAPVQFTGTRDGPETGYECDQKKKKINRQKLSMVLELRIVVTLGER